MRQPVQVMIYPARFINGKWEFLLLRRRRNPSGTWQGITGGMEENEDVYDTAERELTEETGVTSFLLKNTDYSFNSPIEDENKHAYASGINNLKWVVFVAYFDVQQKITMSGEHDKCGWYQIDEALKLLRWPGDIDGLKQCDKFIGLNGR